MSGIVGSKFNHRGSGLVGSLGTDGQHLLSSGAGVTNVFETVAAGGGKILQVQHATFTTETSTTGTSLVVTEILDQITPSSSDSKILVIANYIFYSVESAGIGGRGVIELQRQIDGGGYDGIYQDEGNVSVSVKASGTSYNWTIAMPQTLTFVDSPSTTSAVDYAVYFSGAWNNDAGDTISTGTADIDSSMTLMEIDGS